LPIDPVVLSLSNQICEVFTVPEDKKNEIIEWIKSKNNKEIAYLINKYIDEKLKL
jgi:hypothetical protein